MKRDYSQYVIKPPSQMKQATGSSKYPLKDLAMKYYDQLETMVNDLAEKSTGGEEATVVFSMGKVTIKLR